MTISSEPSALEGPLRCATCDYELTGLPETGHCPECAYSIDESIRHRGGWTVRRLRTLRMACVSFAMAWLPWCLFGLAMLSNPTTLLRVLVGLFIIAHVALLEISMLAATAAGSTRPPRGRLVIMALTTVPMLSCSTLLAMVIMQGVNLGPSGEGVVVVSAVCRAAVFWFAVWWLTRCHRSLSFAEKWWRGVQLIGAAIVLASWVGAVVLNLAINRSWFEWSRWTLVIDIGIYALASVGAVRLAWLAQRRLRAIRRLAPPA